MDIGNSPFIEKIIPFLKRWEGLILGAIDILAIFLAFECSFLINYFYEISHYHESIFFFYKIRLLKLFILIMPFWLVILYLIQITEIPRTKQNRVLFFEYLQSTVLIVILLLIFYFVFKLYQISRIFLIVFAMFGFIFLFVARLLEYKCLKFTGQKGLTRLMLL